MRIVVDWEQCESNALCMDAAPDVFEVGEDDLLHLLQERPPADRRAAVEHAVRMCPKQALSIEE